MCGGFTCSKNALIALNIVYVVVAFLLIGVATYGKTASIITNLGVVGGIVACGVLLLFIAVLGLIGAVKHHQVLLFFYMLVLFLLYILQFSLACACLAITPHQQEALLQQGWNMSSPDIKTNAQETFSCCGFQTANNTGLDEGMTHPACPPTECCPGQADPKQCCMGIEFDCNKKCLPCFDKLKEAINSGLRVSGGIGLFFSFTELIGFVIAYRFRNQMDPSRGQMLD